MTTEPDIIRELREAEKLGILQCKVKSTCEEMEMQEKPSEDVPGLTTGFIDDMKKTTKSDEAYNENERENEDRFRMIFENVNDILIYLDIGV